MDPRRRLNENDKEALRRIYRQDGLLLVRGGELTADEQVEFCRIFGPVPLDQHDVYFVSNTRDDGILADLELLFHHDIPYVPAPFLAGCLHAVDVTPGVSTTRFANGFAAARAPLRKLNRSEETMLHNKVAVVTGRGAASDARVASSSRGTARWWPCGT